MVYKKVPCLLSGLQRLTNQRKLKLNMYRLKNEEELEKQQLYTDIEQTLLSLHTGYSEHQQALSSFIKCIHNGL